MCISTIKIMARFVIYLNLIVSVAACSSNLVVGETGFIRDHASDYVKGESLPPLKMPPGVVQLQPDPYYVIPTVPNASTATHVSIMPPRVAKHD